MNRMNPTTVFLAGTVLVLIALFASGTVGGILLLLVALVAGAMTMGVWPRLPLVSRGARLVVLALLVAFALKLLF